jgi:hypothetical protein
VVCGSGVGWWKISLTDHERKEEALQRFKEERNIPQTI